jgi:hypothetical protein
MLCLSDRYTNSRDRCDLVEHDNPATRAPVLQAIEELEQVEQALNCEMNMKFAN